MFALARGEMRNSVPKGQEKGLDMMEGMPRKRAVRGSEEFIQGLTRDQNWGVSGISART